MGHTGGSGGGAVAVVQLGLNTPQFNTNKLIYWSPLNCVPHLYDFSALFSLRLEQTKLD